MQSKFIFFVLTFFLIVTCSTLKNDKTMGTDAPKKSPAPAPAVSTTSIETKQLANEAESGFVTEVKFSEGSKTLPPDARRSIQSIFERASKKGEVAAAKVITWADQEYPDKKDKELSDRQIKLVEDRNDNLEAYLEKLKVGMEVDKISMAERPGVMEGIMSGENVRLKESIEDSQVDDKSSKSIVMFILKQAQEEQNL
jgi:hypothetical protein